eukprot:1258958-Prymnesium_polylepis.1
MLRAVWGLHTSRVGYVPTLRMRHRMWRACSLRARGRTDVLWRMPQEDEMDTRHDQRAYTDDDEFASEADGDKDLGADHLCGHVGGTRSWE